MGFCEILTIIFIVLKVLDIISWSWWVVFAPEIVALVIYVVFFVLSLIGVGKTHKFVKKQFDDFDF